MFIGLLGTFGFEEATNGRRRRGQTASPRAEHVRRVCENMRTKEDPMRYLLQIYSAGMVETFERLSADEQDAIREEVRAVQQLPGVVGAARLQPVETATTVRVENGQALLTDGPFVDAKEHVGGFALVEADDLDGALEIAARIPIARLGGAIEVRPLAES
jgi:hypothetical protein